MVRDDGASSLFPDDDDDDVVVVVLVALIFCAFLNVARFALFVNDDDDAGCGIDSGVDDDSE